MGGGGGVSRFNGKLSKVAAKDLVVFQLQHYVMDSRGLEFRIGAYGLTYGGSGRNLAHFLSSLKHWIALSYRFQLQL